MKASVTAIMSAALATVALVFCCSQYIEIGRLKAMVEKMGQSNAELARKLAAVDSRTQMSVETIALAQKNAKDIDRLREISKEAVKILGSMIGDLQTKFEKADFISTKPNQSPEPAPTSVAPPAG